MHAGTQHLQPRLTRLASSGLSLVELMVAITIGLLVLLAMTALLSQQNRARDELGKSAAQNENGRYALMLLQSDLQHAGFYGQFDGSGAAPAALPDPCSTVPANIEEAMGMPVQGYNAVVHPIPAPLSGCLVDANHVAGTDVLVVRRLHTGAPLITTVGLVAKRVYAQTTPFERVVDRGENPGSFTLLQKDLVTLAEIRPVVTNIYFISPCDVFAAGQTACTAAADGGSPIPTLKRLELGVAAGGGATAFTIVPLVQGIEDLQFDFGVDTDGNGAPSSPFIVAPTLAQWPAVMAVAINLRARNTEPTRGYTDTKIYNMGVAGDVDLADDQFKRHVYSTTVRLNNPSGRRE